MKPLLIAVVLCLLAQSHCLASCADEVPYDKPFRSPDGRFTAVLSSPGPTQSDRLVVADASTKQSAEGGVLSPLFSVRWSGDSQTIVTIEHIAHGSQTALLHYAGGQWQRYEVEPPGNDSRGYSVVRQRIRSHTVDVTYRVMELHERSSQKEPEYFVCTLRVDCATGAILKVIAKRTVSQHTFEHLSARM